MGRVKFAARNILFGLISNVTYTVLGFVLRTIFLSRLGETLLGVNGLYTGILSVVSLAELGIGTAMNYSLYGPAARKDYEKIKSYMLFFKKAYLCIAAVVALLGVAVIPFLPRLVKNTVGLTAAELTSYYLIFLFNTVSTYFMAYKYSLANAEQKNYIQVNAATVSKLVTTALQIVILLTTADFFLYLLAVAVVELIQKIIMNAYLNRKYPYLKEKQVKKLTLEEKRVIAEDTKALAIQKAGDAARLQTDSIIISYFINVAAVGLVDNYNMIIAAVAGVMDTVFNSVISGFGNAVATEGKEKQFELLKVYRFLEAWLYGFSATGFWFLISPLIEVAWGSGWVLGGGVIFCIIFDYYLKGERIVLYNFKTAAGIFRQDKYLALLQGIVNLIVSVVMVRRAGLIGVYYGTVVSGLMANLYRPFLIYKGYFGRSTAFYFVDSLKYLAHLLLTAAVLAPLSHLVLAQKSWGSLFLMAAAVTVVFNGLFLLFFARGGEFKYLLGILKRRKRGGVEGL